MKRGNASVSSQSTIVWQLPCHRHVSAAIRAKLLTWSLLLSPPSARSFSLEPSSARYIDADYSHATNEGGLSFSAGIGHEALI